MPGPGTADLSAARRAVDLDVVAGARVDVVVVTLAGPAVPPRGAGSGVRH
ncbi:hypothetical protein ACU610_20905 [Geodermatophilus sp. URMC 61]